MRKSLTEGKAGTGLQGRVASLEARVDELEHAINGNPTEDTPRSAQHPIDESLLTTLRRYVMAEPARLAILSYAWLTAVGFSRIFGNGMAFGVNAIDLASPGDFLLAGLRDPFVVLAAAASGAGLFWLWGRSQGSHRARHVLLPVVILLLGFSSWLSSLYRWHVVAGSLKGKCYAPLPAVVTLKEGREKKSGLRLAFTSTDFLVFHDEGGNNTIVERKDNILQIDFAQRPDQCWY